MLRILQINKAYFPVVGGIERVVQQIAEGLNESCDMQVLVCQKKGKTVYETENGVSVCKNASIGYWGSLPFPVGFVRRIKKMAADRDVLLVHAPFPFADLACLLSGYRGKIVIWWHSDVVRQKLMLKFYEPVMRRFLKRADAVIVASKGVVQGSKYLQEYKEKCVVIPYGVQEQIKQYAEQYVAGRRKESVTSVETTVRFLFIGRLVYYKGCDVLLQAFSKVENAALTIVGTGPLESSLKSYAEENGLSEKIRFEGYAEEENLHSYFEQCDVFVLPSVERSEAFGIVQIEAMAFRKPVINTRLASGVPEVSIDGVTGLTVEPGNVEELTRAMQWMVNHPTERMEFGLKARQRVEQEYTLGTMIKRTENFLQTVCKQEERK